jgi:deoxynucleoside triphosphate triphosphohydrolase SAMHD1
VTQALTLGEVQALAERLASRYLDTYVDALRAAPAAWVQRKEINDAISGTIALSQVEAVVLDSPLLQRLRFVRQLGAVHWVYPSAIHTRFEHVLGALHQAQQLTTALNVANRSVRPKEQPLMDDSAVQLVRLAILFKDVGHVAFSEVTEGALEELPGFATVSKDLSAKLRWTNSGDDVPLSRVITYFIVRSPSVRALLYVLVTRLDSKLNFHADLEQNLTAIVERLSLALIGRKIDDRVPLLHELVRGPYDAGKLDALVRDARFAGIPNVLDVQRLLQKLAVDRMLAKDLPETIAGSVIRGEEDPVWLFGVKASAASVLDEVQLAEVLVTTKVYSHHKVLAVEQMLRAFVGAIGISAPPTKVFEFLFNHADDALLGTTVASMSTAFGSVDAAHAAERHERLTASANVLSAVRERRLWVRAFQLPQPNSAFDGNDVEAAGIARLREDFEHIQKREHFMTLVREEVHRILVACGRPEPNRIALDSLVIGRMLKSSSSETGIGRALLIQKTKKPYALSYLMRARGHWVERYMIGQPKAYIFCPANIADAVFLAVEKIVATKYRAVLPSTAAEASKRSEEVLLELRRKLPAAHWNGLPFEIRPQPRPLERADAHKIIGAFSKLRQQYQEPKAPDGEPSSGRMALERTNLWLRQFETDEDADCALFLLSQFKLLNRNDMTQGLSGFLSQHKAFRHGWAVPFGNVKDSSSVTGYFSADLGIRTGTIEQHILNASAGTPIVFVDDFISSGRQATDILAAWFDRSDLRTALGEQRDALTPELCEHLLKVPLAFVFTAGWDEGVGALQTICSALGLKATVYCHIKETDLPFAGDVLEVKYGKERTAQFLAKCKAIGEELLRSEPRDEPMTSDLIERRSLGYGGRAMLLGSIVNVPAQTLTAIWMEGQVDGTTWMPLLRRRKKN